MTVYHDALHIRFAPFVDRWIALAEIEQVEAVDYRPIARYGGWSVRGLSQRNVAYNVSGKQGVRLRLKDGSQTLIGSQKPHDLAMVITANLSRRA